MLYVLHTDLQEDLWIYVSRYEWLPPSCRVSSYSHLSSNLLPKLFMICEIKMSEEKKTQNASPILFLHPLMSINVCVCL